MEAGNRLPRTGRDADHQHGRGIRGGKGEQGGDLSVLLGGGDQGPTGGGGVGGKRETKADYKPQAYVRGSRSGSIMIY